jgi:tetratricopeptide (TPR) repeat protein
MDTGQWQQAEDLLTKSLEGAPDDAGTRRSLAETLWHRDARQEAIAQIEKAVAHDEDNPSLRVRAGEMALAAGLKQEALAHANRAIRNDPKNPTAWALRGRCFQKMNDPDRALADLQHGLEFDPSSSDMLSDVAMLYRQRGMPERSLTTIHHLLDAYSPGEEPAEALALEGVTLLELGRPQQACEALALATQRGKPNADTFYYLAQAYSAAGDVEKASATAQQALAINASHQPARELLAQLASRADNLPIQRR